MRQRQRATLPVGHVGINFQIRPVVNIGRFPLLLVAFKLTAVTNKWCFGCQRQHLGFLADPVVIHALGVFGVPHQSADVHAAIYLKFVADYADNGDVFTRPIALF